MSDRPGIPAGSITPAVVVTPDDFQRIKSAFPLAASRGGDIEALARAAGVTVAAAQAALDGPGTALQLLDAQQAAEDNGRLLKPVAARVTLAMLTKLQGEVDAGNLDADDIGNLLPKVHRVVEHADRIEAGSGDSRGNLPMFHITFINGGMQARMVSPAANVIDVAATEVQD